MLYVSFVSFICLCECVHDLSSVSIRLSVSDDASILKLSDVCTKSNKTHRDQTYDTRERINYVSVKVYKYKYMGYTYESQSVVVKMKKARKTMLLLLKL